MKPLDKKFLTLQFRNKIHSKKGSEYQSFFEDIMEKVFPDFQKVRPYGNEGDGGNDGYRKELGLYYQVYAPNEPQIKEADAAKKLKNNFQRLKNEWDEISNIKEYNFVLNDDYRGTVKPLEKALSDLEKANPGIKFKPFYAKNLEQLFFRLDEADILDLDFIIDRRQAISNAYTDLETVKRELDNENVLFAHKLLETNKEKISSLDDEDLLLEFEILESRCLQKFEQVDEARERYTNISKRFTDDVRPILNLAEIYLNDKNYGKNSELLEQAEKIDPDHWLLKLEKLIRKLHLSEKIDTTSIDDKTFPDDPKIKSNFYRLYALILDANGDQKNADSFIGKALLLNPDRFSNHLDELSIFHRRMMSTQDAAQREMLAQELLGKIEKVESKFSKNGDIGARNKANLNVIKLDALLIQDNIRVFERLSKETFELLISCYFDRRIELMIAGILQFVELPVDDFNKLLEYLLESQNSLSDDFAKVLILQFNLKGTLLTDGKEFFRRKKSNSKYSEFINDLDNSDYEKVLDFLLGDTPFAIWFANTLKSLPDLRKKIIESLPDDKNIQKEKLWLLLNFDEKDFDDAFQILKKLDLSSLEYIECRTILQIIQYKKAWDFEIIVLQKLLEREKDERIKYDLKLQLFTAYFNLGNYSEAINIGEPLLAEDLEKNLLSTKNKEVLLAHTIISCFQRGNINEGAFNKAKDLLEKYPLVNPSFEFKVGVEAEVYINNNEFENGLGAIVEGVKIKKVLTAPEYAKLSIFFSVKLGNRVNLTLESLAKVEENTFIKITNEDQWYFDGEDNELDALKINIAHANYSLFIDKELGDKVVFENKYSSTSREEEIEFIFSIEQYILWQTTQKFQKLTRQGSLDWAWVIDVPQKDGTTDFGNLLKFLEDENARTEPFFDMYCKNTYPLAALVVNEGGITNAIGRIQRENRGFIHFSSGTPDEFEKQKETARKVIDEKIPFYIDGTSALFMAESGFLEKVYKYLPNLRVPQSVINLLVDLTGRFKFSPGQMGFMGYSKGRITFSPVENIRSDYFQANFRTSIKLLESNPDNMGNISWANKAECFSEQKIPDELIDACILAQRENRPILTDDYLYLKLNELETAKKAPEYFSSLALIKVLYEKKLLSFSEYLEYFGYLSGYRFRFLSLGSIEIEKAVFGDSSFLVVITENIRRFNFPLTLSEEYGVSFQDAIRVVASFLLKVLRDNSITVDISEKIFMEILETFPTNMNKMELGQLLLRMCLEEIERSRSRIIIQPENKLLDQKINRLLQLAKILGWKTKIWTPN